MNLRARPAALIAVLGLCVAGCSSDGDTGITSSTVSVTSTTSPTPTSEATPTTMPTTTVPTSGVPTTAAVAPATAVTYDSATWERVVPGLDCECSDGSEFSFYVRHADPTKVVLFFQGGGACFSVATCDPRRNGTGTYKATTDARDDPAVGIEGGIFDFANDANPFRDYSFVFVPYCTGDFHLGNAETTYAPDLVIEHKGYVNGSAALAYLVATFPDAEQLVVTGESAGSVPTPLYAGLAADSLPDARITVLADGSGVYPDDSEVNAQIGALWGAANAIPAWPENQGITPAEWGYPGLFVQAGKHAPDIVFARHDYAHDAVQQLFLGLMYDSNDDLLALVDRNETQIEQAGVELLSFIAPGAGHTVLHNNLFYTEEVNGVRLVDWVTALVNGEHVTDEHCASCQ